MWRHLRKSVEGEAVQFTEDGKNDSIIASWIGVHPKRVNDVKAVAAHRLNGAPHRAHRGNGAFAGDWLIRTKTGTVLVCPADDFESHWAKKDDDGIVIPKPVAEESKPIVPHEERAPFPPLLGKKR